MIIDREDLLTVRDAAKVCGRDPETVRRWIWQGRLAAQKLGNQLFIRRQDLRDFLSGNRRPRFRSPRPPKYDKAQLRKLMEEDRKLRERIFAECGYFDVSAAVRESREEH